MSFGSLNRVEKRVEFVKMRGPLGKGYAEMAVSRQSPPNQSSSDSNTDASLAESFQINESVIEI
jgi:hypothetical protein